MIKDYSGSKLSPFHLSVGAIAISEDGRICCHHYKSNLGNEDVYTLMTETLMTNETIENALRRGLLEEFGISISKSIYIGSFLTHYYLGDIEVQKTILYFLCSVALFEPSKRDKMDVEGRSEIEWLTVRELSEKLSNQTKRKIYPSFDHSNVLSRVEQAISNNILYDSPGAQ